MNVTIRKISGFDHAINILKELKKKDGRYKLYVAGKRPEEFANSWNIPEERAYYQKVYQKIKENHINSCSKCDKIAMCPLSMCTAINVNESLCKRIKDRICTLEYVFNEVLSIWQNS